MSIPIVAIVRLLACAFMGWLLVLRVDPRGYAQEHGRSIPLANLNRKISHPEGGSFFPTALAAAARWTGVI